MMDTNSKKQEELRIFDLVYADRSFDEVKEFENPDFLVRYFPNTSYFGVEVTEYYLTETNARIDNISGYTGQLLNGNDFKHKDDSKVLNVAEIDIINKDGSVLAKNVSSIIQEVPPPIKCAYDVADRIISKAARFQASHPNLSHTNLIIKDRTGLLRLINKKNFYGIYFIPELIKAISTAPFREIFLVTILQDEHVYVPLKMLHLLAEAYLFNGAIIQNGYEKKIPPEIDYVELFAAYLNSTVTYRVLIHRDADDTEVIFGDSGILISPDNSVTVRLHLDYTINSNAVLPSIEWQTILGEHFDEAMRDYRKSNVFSTEAVFPVKQRATQQGGCT
jgi:hypothetical protein